EGRRNQRSKNDHDVKERDRDQYLDDALTDQVETSAEISLQTADDGADHLPNEGEKQRKENRNPEAIEQAGSDIASPGVRTKIMIAMSGVRRRWRHVAQANEGWHRAGARQPLQIAARRLAPVLQNSGD